MSEVDELLCDLVEIPSVSGNEAAAANVVERFAAERGWQPQRQGNNVWFELGQGTPRLLLHSHIDTVPPCAGWEGDPWGVRREGYRLTGLGANDAKGCVAAILFASDLLSADNLPLKGTLVVAITAEEETGGPGGIVSVLPQFGSLDAAVFGEPTGLAPCTAQCGMLLLRCSARGQSGHVAHAGALGMTNAIHVAARDITRLAELKLPEYTGVDGQPVTCRPQVTLIHGGISANQVPDTCEFRVDLRTTPNMEHGTLLKQISALLESELECVSQRYLPVGTAESESIVQAAVAASGRQAFFSRTVSDWSLVPGIPAVKIGPGETVRSHQPNEYIMVDELYAGIDCYRQLVHSYFGGDSNG